MFSRGASFGTKSWCFTILSLIILAALFVFDQIEYSALVVDVKDATATTVVTTVTTVSSSPFDARSKLKKDEDGCLVPTFDKPRWIMDASVWSKKWITGVKDLNMPITWQSFSQSGEEDYLIRNFFGGLRNGVFLEMGGLDGKGLSNTYFLEKEMGWKGVLIEASPRSFVKLKENRPNVVGLNAAACNQCMEVTWAYNEGVSEDGISSVDGIWEFMDPTFKKGFYKNGPGEGSQKIQCQPLDKLMAAVGISHVNFFSLDVEGAELSVLKGIDFERFSFDVLVLEADRKYMDQLATAELASHGYVLHSTQETGHGENIWFVSNLYAERGIKGYDFV